MPSTEQDVRQLAKQLRDQVVDATEEPDLDDVVTLLRTLESKTPAITVEILQSTGIGKALTKSIRTLKRHKRTASDRRQKYQTCVSMAEQLLETWKTGAATESRAKTKTKASTAAAIANKEGLPTTVTEYKKRLEIYKADMYKNPPKLPPATIIICPTYCPPPKRNPKTHELAFVATKAGNDYDDALDDISALLRDFHPNRTPKEVLQAGSFGGTYYRPIGSSVTNKRYTGKQALKQSVPDDWIAGLDAPTMLTSMTYRKQVNKYGVKCGGSLGMWESSGWISDSDPYGWFQWYCRFYQGRRCSDDTRQIQRWLKSAGPKGRFRSQLCNKIWAAKTTPTDASISPVIRQTLLHWGLEITEFVMDAHITRMKLK